MKQNFSQPMDKRTIVVEIDKQKDAIDFSFKDAQWFYDIPISEWDKSYPFWQDHMREKRWFTNEMESFINQSLQTTEKT